MREGSIDGVQGACPITSCHFWRAHEFRDRHVFIAAKAERTIGHDLPRLIHVDGSIALNGGNTNVL